jgi:hypothetical protein
MQYQNRTSILRKQGKYGTISRCHCNGIPLFVQHDTVTPLVSESSTTARIKRAVEILNLEAVLRGRVICKPLPEDTLCAQLSGTLCDLLELMREFF